MADHRLIDEHLRDLARRLPADALDELADGLLETWHHHLAAGLAPDAAARAAIAEFGSPRLITHAFVTRAPGRRAARLLLATGPVVGVCWAAALLAAPAGAWRMPPVAAATVATALIGVVALLAIAATSRRGYRRTRLGSAGGLGLVIVDTAALAAVLGPGPGPAWPMLAAIVASAARIVLTLRVLPRTLTGR